MGGRRPPLPDLLIGGVLLGRRNCHCNGMPPTEPRNGGSSNPNRTLALAIGRQRFRNRFPLSSFVSTATMDYSYPQAQDLVGDEIPSPDERVYDSQPPPLWFGGTFTDSSLATAPSQGGGAAFGHWPHPSSESLQTDLPHTSTAHAPYDGRSWAVPPWELLAPLHYSVPGSGDVSSFQPTPAATNAASSASSAPDSPTTLAYHTRLLPPTVADNATELAVLTAVPNLSYNFGMPDYQQFAHGPPSSTAFSNSLLSHDPRVLQESPANPNIPYPMPARDWAFVPSHYDDDTLTFATLPPATQDFSPLFAQEGTPPTIDLTADSGDEAELFDFAEAEALMLAKRMPPRTLELRVITGAEINRLTAAERRNIYTSSLETHAAKLEGYMLDERSHACNRERIEQLKGIEAKDAKATIIRLHSEVQRLRDRANLLKARNKVLREDALMFNEAKAAARSLPPSW